MPTIVDIIAAKKNAGIAADPLAQAATASSPLIALAKPDPVLVTTGPPPRLYSQTPQPAALPAPVQIIPEDAALARLFPVAPGSAASEVCNFRRDWMRLRIPSAVDPQGVRFYAVPALDVLAPHAGALMAAEKEAAREARRIKIGKIVEEATAEGLSPADTMARIAAMKSK